MKTISLIVTSYNEKEQLSKFLNVVKPFRNIFCDVTIVDNNSEDGTGFLALRHPWANWVFLRENVGTPAVNEAIRRGLAKGELLMFTSNDHLFNEKTVLELAKPFDESRSIGQTCPILYDLASGIDVSGSELSWLYYAKGTTKLLDGEPKEAAFYGTGMILREALKDRDYRIYDDTYFLYAEDVELGLYLKQKGYKIVVIPSAKMFHLGHQIERFMPEHERMFYVERNMLRNFLKYGNQLLFPLVFGARIARAAYNFLQGKPLKALARLKAIQAVW